MKANEFVKKFGWGDAAKVSKIGNGCFGDLHEFISHRDCEGFEIIDNVLMPDLKTLVDAWELVERFGTIEQAKANLNHMSIHGQYEFCATNLDELGEAINLVESCQ